MSGVCNYVIRRLAIYASVIGMQVTANLDFYQVCGTGCEALAVHIGLGCNGARLTVGLHVVYRTGNNLSAICMPRTWNRYHQFNHQRCDEPRKCSPT